MKKGRCVSMREIFIWGLAGVLTLVVACGAAEAKLPRDFQEFKARYETEGRTIDGAAKLYFEAVFCYFDVNTRDEASKMLRYAMYLSMPLERSNSYATFVDRLKDRNYHHIFRSYAVGTSPENSYAMSPDDFELNIVSRERRQDYTVLNIRSSGADHPRGVWMQEHDGLWYMTNNANTYMGIRDPRAAVDARRNAHDADFD